MLRSCQLVSATTGEGDAVYASRQGQGRKGNWAPERHGSVATDHKIQPPAYRGNSVDTMVESEAKRLRLEDPEYAASRGLSIVHFEPKNQAAATRRGNWLMLSKKWGHSTSNIVEPVDINKRHERVLSKYHLEQIQVIYSWPCRQRF